MKADKKLIITVLVVVVLAGAFWMLLLLPQREEANKLGKQVGQLNVSLSQHEAEAATALAAKQEFPTNYSQLVVLGKAAPTDSETPSLLVQLQHVADQGGVRFESINLDSEGGEATASAPVEVAPEAASGSSEALVSPTEVAAATSPLGASIGPAGLSVMPYTLTFTGDFFHVADFIQGLDKLVKTTNADVSVDGRLITVNSFSLAPTGGTSNLNASFSVTTYLTPPEEGLTAGATPSGPATEELATGTQTSATVEGTP
jgi:Tfp pilus assembly protein PilO